MPYRKSLWIFGSVLSLLAAFGCSSDHDGGQAGVEAGNAKIVGVLTDSLQSPLGNAIVGIYPSSTTAALSRKFAALPAGALALDTTDLAGNFELNGLKAGDYSLQIEYQGTTWLKPQVKIGESDQPIEMAVSLNEECVDVVIWIGGTMIALLCEGSTWGEDTTDWGEDTLGFWDTIPISSWCDTAGYCGSFVDARDEREYRWTRIGSQFWLAQNLDFAEPSTGTSYCYQDSAYYCDRYGRLYTWDAALVACPSGWRVPTWYEWQALIDSVGDAWTAGEGFKLENMWLQEPGGDAFGFAAYPAGSRAAIYAGVGEYAMWWFEDRQYPQSNGQHVMYLETNEIGLIDTYQPEGSAHSLRCIYASSGPPE